MYDLEGFREYLHDSGLSDLTVTQYVSTVRAAQRRSVLTAPLSDTSKSASTRNAYWCALRKWALYAEDIALLQVLEKPSTKRDIRAVGAKLPKKTIPLSDSDFDKFMDALDHWRNEDGWLWPVLSLMITLGLRAGVDLCGIRRDALTEAQATGTISLWTKRGKVRELPLKPVQEAVDRLLSWDGWTIVADLLVDSDTPGDTNHLRSAYGHVRRAVKLVATKAGLDPSTIGSHRFRHNFGKYVYDQTGNDLLLTQRALGHASPNTTQIYVSSDDSKLGDVLSTRGK